MSIHPTNSFRLVLGSVVVTVFSVSIALSILQANRGEWLGVMVQLVVLPPCLLYLAVYWWRNREAINRKLRSWGL